MYKFIVFFLSVHVEEKIQNISGVASYGALVHVPPSTFDDFILVHFGVKSES